MSRVVNEFFYIPILISPYFEIEYFHADARAALIFLLKLYTLFIKINECGGE